jgi:hypothetical protein
MRPRVRRWSNVPCTLSLELEVRYLSSRYDDPGNAIGDPDRCWAPESDEERILDRIFIEGKELPPELRMALEPFLQSAIDAGARGGLMAWPTWALLVLNVLMLGSNILLALALRSRDAHNAAREFVERLQEKREGE